MTATDATSYQTDPVREMTRVMELGYLTVEDDHETIEGTDMTWSKLADANRNLSVLASFEALV